MATEKNPFDPFGVWTDVMSKMLAPMWGGFAQVTPPEAARDARGALLEAWAQSAEQFMRSPLFLESMRRAIETNVEFRKRMGDWLGQCHHEMQGVSRQDFDQIMRGMRHLEHRAADSMERMSDMLEEVTERLDALERRLGEDGSLSAENGAGSGTENAAENGDPAPNARSKHRRRSKH